jgi:hypothetical protein
MNIKFNYQYRDGANYKNCHSEVFSNARTLSIEEVQKRIQSVVIEGEYFIASDWQLKDLHSHLWDEEIDHNWHEFVSVEETSSEATKEDISVFLKRIGNK